MVLGMGKETVMVLDMVSMVSKTPNLILDAYSEIVAGKKPDTSKKSCFFCNYNEGYIAWSWPWKQRNLYSREYDI